MKVPGFAAVIEPSAGAKAGPPEHFRRLKWNELVKRGDFVADGRQGFEPWAGLAGFRADAFVKQIFRPSPGRSVQKGIVGGLRPGGGRRTAKAAADTGRTGSRAARPD